MQNDTKKISSGAQSSKKSTGCKRNLATSRTILNEAASLLQDKGYANFTIEEVARRSGASKSTIYRWWATRMHLLLDIYSADIEKDIPVPDFGSAEKEIIFLVRAIWKLWRETPSGQAYKSMIAEAQADSSAIAQWRSTFLPERRWRLVVILQRAADRGELRPDVDIEIVIDMLFGFCWYRLLTGQIEDDVRVIKKMVREITCGITRKRSP